MIGKLGRPRISGGRLLAALRVLLERDMEKVQDHDLNTLKSLSAEAPLEYQMKWLSFALVLHFV